MASESDEGRIVVFAGPTIPAQDRARLPGAVYLPPAEQGSFVRAMRDHAPEAIALVDGAFGRVPAVRHKEILWTLAQGVRVYGAASIGALRAAELADQGMEGFGLIYRWYRRTPLLDDDEVAVATTPPELGATPLGDALVDIRLTLRRAERHGVIDRDLRETLEREAQSTYFIERSYDTVLRAAAAGASEERHLALVRLRGALPALKVEQKRVDALGLLSLLSVKSPSPPRPARDFVVTEAWAYDLFEDGEGASESLQLP
jgi:hypothetical protein